jgi:SAM-dependent methyltransferase
MPSSFQDTLDPTTWTRGPVADLFSSYVATSAISAAHELGLLDDLARTGSTHFSGDAEGRLNSEVVKNIHRALNWAGIVEIKESDRVIPGPRFAETYAARGYFYWLVRGCGTTFSAAPQLALESERTGEFYRRDMRAVALGSRLIGDEEVEHLFDSLFSTLKIRRIADLGCGSGQRLIRVAGNHPEVTCVGVDISEASVRLATEASAESGLEPRMEIIKADVLELTPRPEFADVDIVTCVFMGHDFWPYESCVRTLRRLRTAFPAAERLLLCDVVRTTELPGAETPIFTLGFESIHALMGVPLPTKSDWHRAFAEGGWVVDTVHSITAPPNGYLFELSPRA